MGELNIDTMCANTPQAKGRVERANSTLQDRLVKELRLANITTRQICAAAARVAALDRVITGVSRIGPLPASIERPNRESRHDARRLLRVAARHGALAAGHVASERSRAAIGPESTVLLQRRGRDQRTGGGAARLGVLRQRRSGHQRTGGGAARLGVLRQRRSGHQRSSCRTARLGVFCQRRSGHQRSSCRTARLGFLR